MRLVGLALLVLLRCGGEGGGDKRAIEIPPPVPLPSREPVVVDASVPEVAVAQTEPTVTFDSSWTDDNSAGDIALTIDFTQMRKHPDGARAGLVIGGDPRWRSVLPDAAGVPKIDIARDFDWMKLSGPSLIDTSNDDILAHLNLTDAAVDTAVDTLARTTHGNALNLHVTGAKAWKVVLDRSDHTMIHASHVVAAVPMSRGPDTARELVAHPPATPKTHADEVLRIRVAHPATRITAMPADVSEMRLWIDGHPSDGSADVYVEGDCPTNDAARADADAVRTFIQQKNTVMVRIVTAGLFNNVAVAPSGNQVRVRIHATRAQVKAVLALLASQVGVNLPP
jgi:hypothetical protein